MRDCRPALAALAVMALGMASAAAQDYPVKPITLIIPWPAGGSTDVVLRAVADAAGKQLGQPVIVENKAGGSGTIGPATMAAVAKPDGYTISQIPVTVFRLPLLQDTTWDPDKDFTYIIHLSGYVQGIVANADTPFRTWQDVVDYAKQNPGKVTYGSSGTGGSTHIGTEQIAAKSGIKLTHVPFKGNAEVNAAVAGGHTMLGAAGASSKPLADAGKVRFLNIWTAKRVAGLPDVPTLHDLGFGLTLESPFGIAGPKGLDPRIVAKLHDAFKKSLDDPAVVAAINRYDMTVNYLGPDDYAKFVKVVTAEEKATLETIGLGKKK